MKTNTRTTSASGSLCRGKRGIAAVILVALLLSGCQTSKTTSQPTSQAEALGPTAITLFGATVASRQQHLVLPYDVLFVEWLARDGQRLEPDDSVFQIDRIQWERQSDQQKSRQQVMAADLAVLQNQIDQLNLQIVRWQKSSQADLESGLAILENLVRTTSQTRRNSYETALYDYLVSIDGLSLHLNLVNLTRDSTQVKNLARPILAQWLADLQDAADEAILQEKVLRQQLLASQAELAEIAEQLALLDNWLAGKVWHNLGYLDKEGRFIYNGSACLLGRSAAQDGVVLPAGQPVAAFTSLPVSMVSVPVDEQLIPQVAIGATVQISPLYDQTVVWIGNVTFISEKAVIMNGETVIPVLVSTDEVLPGPGFTVIAKILPVAP